MNNKNIIIAGVGGQGTLLASRILGAAAIKLNLDVKVSEVHGMSQRGGSVVTYVKYGAKIYSPIICKGEADFIIAFEQLEALRWQNYLKKDGIILASNQEIPPMPVINGATEYPKNITEKIKQSNKIIAIDAFNLAKNAGTEKASNVVMIGLLAKIMKDEISKEIYLQALKESVNEKILGVNLAAFEAGYNYNVA